MKVTKLYSGKPATSVCEQLKLFTSRGLIIEDQEKAEYYLNHIGYFRFKGYALNFQINKTTHELTSGTTFQNILDLYIFDRKLRLHIMDALERIEVALKAQLSLVLSNKHTPIWYSNKNFFNENDDFRHLDFLEGIERELNRSKAPFLTPYKNTKTKALKDYPPSWMMFEVASFGTISKIIYNLKNTYRADIAKNFNIHPYTLGPCIRSLAVLRNSCAHHSIVWNGKLPYRPKIPQPYDQFTNNLKSPFVYNRLLCISYLMGHISGNSEWNENLIRLIKGHSFIDMSKMGFPEKWEEMPIWQDKSSKSSNECKWLNHSSKPALEAAA